jgi:fibronectin-binding autotransporter adhesin
VQTLGTGGRTDSDGNGDGWRYRSNGFVLGYDQPLDGRWLAGGAVGYSRSWWNATSGSPASGHLDSPQAGLYARYAGDAWRLRLDGTFADHDFNTDRTVNVGAASSTATSGHRGKEWGLAAQLESSVAMGDWQLRPLAGLRYAHLRENAFTETGAGGASLAVAERTTQNTLLAAGMRFVRLFEEGGGGLELRAVASHLAGDNDSPVTASIAGQAGSFTANGAPLRRNALTLGATLSGQFSNSVSGYLDANYEYRGDGQNAHRVTAGVRVSF